MKNKQDQPDPFEFVKKEIDGNTDSTIVLTTFSPADPEKKTPIYIYLDLRVCPAEHAEMNKVGFLKRSVRLAMILTLSLLCHPLSAVSSYP